jgi:hypothetical protein
VQTKKDAEIVSWIGAATGTPLPDRLDDGQAPRKQLLSTSSANRGQLHR